MGRGLKLWSGNIVAVSFFACQFKIFCHSFSSYKSHDWATLECSANEGRPFILTLNHVFCEYHLFLHIYNNKVSIIPNFYTSLAWKLVQKSGSITGHFY